jgi:hypothetical protein
MSDSDMIFLPADHDHDPLILSCADTSLSKENHCARTTLYAEMFCDLNLKKYGDNFPIK